MRRIATSITIGLAWVVLPSSALAADPSDRPLVGPVPGWVLRSPVPKLDGPIGEAAIAVLQQDMQLRLTRDGTQAYTHSYVRVQTSQGLGALGNLTLGWKPGVTTLTVHRLRIISGGEITDLLAKDAPFTVLRREKGLDYATLDGVLTAVVQPEGLKVGDVVEIETTLDRREPVLANHPEGVLATAVDQPVGHVRLRALWDSSLPIRWQAGEGLPPVKERKAGGTSEIMIEADNQVPLLLPRGAPRRFRVARYLLATSYRSWQELSALFAPLYAKAETLRPDSPLKAEIARIAAASPDPVKRAETALALVQAQVRYVALAMNEGGLVPADADTTWQRRFGDCKGKTALLLALLHGLGIDAQPALASVAGGDGLNERLPEAGLFDHILVRATIGGKVYWMDGTRVGDRSLAAIQPPEFHWVLPVTSPGAALAAVMPPVPTRPYAVTTSRIDARAGLTLPAPMHAETIVRGDAATMMRLGFANMSPEQRDRALRGNWTREFDFLSVKTVSASYDEASDEEKLVVDGTATLDWKRGYYLVEAADLGYNADFARRDGLHVDAPFEVDFPSYERSEQVILLPNNGQGVVAPDVELERTIAGVAYRRHAEIKDGVYTIIASRQSVAPEFAAKDAPAAQAALRELNQKRAIVRMTNAYLGTRGEGDAVLAATPQTANDHLRRAGIFNQRGDPKSAIVEYDRAITLDPKLSIAYQFRAGSKIGALDDGKNGADDVAKAIELMPDAPMPRLMHAHLLARTGKPADALAEIDRWIDRAPTDLKGNFLSERAHTHAMLGHDDPALVDSAAALKLQPANIPLYLMRANIFARTGQSDKAVAEAAAVTAANPTNDYAYVNAGAIYRRFHRDAEAAEAFATALKLRPSIYAYLTRADNRPADDLAGRRADIEAAAKLDPNDNVVAFARIFMPRRWRQAIRCSSASRPMRKQGITAGSHT